MQNLINTLIANTLALVNSEKHLLDLIHHAHTVAPSDCSHQDSWILSHSNTAINLDLNQDPNESILEYTFQMLEQLRTQIISQIPSIIQDHIQVHTWDPYSNNPTEQGVSQNILLTAPGFTLTIIITDLTFQITLYTWDC